MNFGANSESVCCGFGHVGQQAKQQFSVQVGVLRADGQRQLQDNVKFKLLGLSSLKKLHWTDKYKHHAKTGISLMSAGQELS